MSSNGTVVDLASGKGLDKLKQEEEEAAKKVIEGRLKNFDDTVRLYRESLSEGNLDSVAILGIIGGYAQPTYYNFDEDANPSDMAIIMKDAAETLCYMRAKELYGEDFDEE